MTIPVLSLLGLATVPAASPAGLLPILLLFAASLALFWYLDRRTLSLLFRGFGLSVLRLTAIAGCIWLLWRSDRWWAYGLWLLVLATVLAVLVVARGRQELRRLLLPVGISVVLSVAIVSGALMACLPLHLLLPVAMVLAASLYVPLSDALRTYNASMAHTRDHRIYLIANGATHLEALIPSIRRALRAAAAPLVRRLAASTALLGPMLFWGMLMGGASVGTALMATLLMVCASFSTTMLAVVLAIAIEDRLTHYKQRHASEGSPVSPPPQPQATP